MIRTQVVNRFETEPIHAPHVVSLKRTKLVESAKKQKMLFKRSLDQSAPGDQPKITLTNLEEKRFGHTYDDRSGIVSWGFYDRLNMWIVKHKISSVEYYKDVHDFSSWTRVDLSELSNAPFSNPSNDPRSNHFKLYLENQVKNGYTGMKTAKSILKQFPDVIDPKANKPFKTVMWPPTNQVRQIPILHNFCDGSLKNILY